MPLCGQLRRMRTVSGAEPWSSVNKMTTLVSSSRTSGKGHSEKKTPLYKGTFQCTNLHVYVTVHAERWDKSAKLNLRYRL